MNDKVKRAIDHVKKNKTIYIVGGVCFVTGAAGSLVVLGPKVAASQRIVAWKPENITQNLIQTTVLARRGHPGNIIQCNETGELFASQRRAAELLGVSRSELWKQLKGEIPDVNGYTFTNRGEAQAA